MKKVLESIELVAWSISVLALMLAPFLFAFLHWLGIFNFQYDWLICITLFWIAFKTLHVVWGK